MEIEKRLTNHHNLIDFPLNPHALALTNSDDDVETSALHSMSYTSLQDLLLSSPPPSVVSPTNNSWREIPIKDPLVQHAAWAYLQPMSEPRDDEDRWWRRIEKKFCWLVSCFNDVVLVVFNGLFAEEMIDADDRVWTPETELHF